MSMKAQPITDPKVFQGQRWSPEASQYYQEIQGTLVQLQKAPCAIDFQVNNTRDSLFKVISPIAQLQLAPFAVDDTIAALRPDIDVQVAIAQGKRIVILESVEKAVYDKTPTPKGFSLIKHLTIPEQHFMPHKQELLIYVPKVCAK